ncbi:hypothetical protein HDU92_000785 [Lobulomyces angularis]|nr:hypothetical protein HDU92_000785 [Lobulomyces angularis]
MDDIDDFKDAESISIEETNIHRAKLGLKPLKIDNTSEKNEEKPTPEENMEEHLKKEKEKKRQRELKELLEKKRNKREANKKLVGETLGDGKVESTWDFLAKVGKKQNLSVSDENVNNETKKKQKYTSKDLKGLRVAHNLQDFADEYEEVNTVLILKDSSVLDLEEEGDQLENVDLVDLNRDKKNAENKKKKLRYSAIDDEETQTGKKRSLLYQYDEELNKGKDEDDNFVLNEGLEDEDEELNKVDEDGDVDMTSNLPSPPMQKSDFENSNAKKFIDDINFVDDDELQNALSRARKLAQKKREEIQEETLEDEVVKVQDSSDEDMDDGGIILTSTSEFVSNLSVNSNITRSDSPKKILATLDNTVEFSKMDVDPENAISETSVTDNRDINSKELDKTELKEEDFVAIEEEDLVSTGMAATLKLLNKKNLLENKTEEKLLLEAQQSEKSKWLIEQKRRDLLLEMEKNKLKEKMRKERDEKYGKGKRGGGAAGGSEDSSWNLDQLRLQQSLERFKNYTPDVNLTYYDEKGRSLTQKEAFREMSHRFHGQKSGKGKTDRRNRKLEEALQLQKLASSDQPLFTASAFEERMKRVGSAHMVLSVGNKATIPEFLPAQINLEKKDFLNGNSKHSGTNFGNGNFNNKVEVIDVTKKPVELIKTAENREKISFGFGKSLKRKVED